MMAVTLSGSKGVDHGDGRAGRSPKCLDKCTGKGVTKPHHPGLFDTRVPHPLWCKLLRPTGQNQRLVRRFLRHEKVVTL
jgi:hypothetical protein